MLSTGVIRGKKTVYINIAISQKKKMMMHTCVGAAKCVWGVLNDAPCC